MEYLPQRSFFLGISCFYTKEKEFQKKKESNVWIHVNTSNIKDLIYTSIGMEIRSTGELVI